jgi:hypothetical protein
MADVSRNFCHHQANVELHHLLTCSGLICLEVPLMPASLQHKIKTSGLSPFFVYSSFFSLPLAIFSFGTILPYQASHDHRLYDHLYLQGILLYCGLCNGLLPWICEYISDLCLLPVPRNSITGSRIEEQSALHGWQAKWHPSPWFTTGCSHCLLTEGEFCAVVYFYVFSYIVLKAFGM